MKNSSMGIRGKLFTLIGVTLFAFVGTVLFANYSVRNVASSVELLSHERLPLSQDVGDAKALSHAISRYSWVAFENAKGSVKRADAIKKVEMLLTQAKENNKLLGGYSSLAEKSRESLVGMVKMVDEMAVTFEKIKAHLTSDKNEEEFIKNLIFNELVPNSNKLTELADDIGTRTIEKNAKIANSAVEDATFAQRSIWAISGIVCLVLVLFGYFFAKSLVDSLSKITESVGAASEQVSSASAQISQGAEGLSTAAQEQASSLEETSASLTEIAGMANSNVKGAEEADRSAQEVYKITEETRKSMEELSSAMGSILTSNERIVKLVKIIEEIGEKTEIIDDIVFKTQLLSFNASVEAERAGEHGRGFAVVAQEVGNLAQMSGKAATEISTIVKGSIKEAESVAFENKEKVEFGSELAHATKEKMETVLTKLSGVIESISKITAASREQSQGVGQITNAIESLNQATQETAGTAEESASASSELTGQAESLMGLVEELRGIVNGASDAHKNYGSSASAAMIHSTKPTKTGQYHNVVAMKKKTKPAPKVSYTESNYEEVKNASGDAWDKL